jgi:tetratricopeptide (TPR) repeat protein/transcriptional regulator with XRE-family HTH domain
MAGDRRDPLGGEGAVFATRLSTCRRSAGLTQQELASLSGLSVRAISNLELGRARSPHPGSVRRLADALSLDGDARTVFLAAARRRLGGGAADPVPADQAGPAPADQAGPSVIPRELPPAAVHFTGRTQELAALTRLLDRPSQEMPGTVVISAIGGTAGVGKTALAVRWAHHVAGRFPDGQLYVNLRGYDPAQPMPTADALAGFLRSLGVPGQDIPTDPDRRAARYRSQLAGKRILVVLDNAGSADQVRPLLPGTPDCTVVVTSRDALAGLVARDGAVRLELDVLPLAEAVTLLRTLIGARVDAEPDAADGLAGQCCRLPLALRVAAELATARPQDPLAVLTADLAARRRRLDLLQAGGDGGTAVREVFSWSMRQLEPATARAFALAALHPGTDLDAWALAAMAGTGHEQAERMLWELARAYLILPAGASRYGMHDLLRAFGRELAASEASAIDVEAALTRLLNYLQHAAASAMDILYPAAAGYRPDLAGSAGPLPPLADEHSARAWLDAERETLIGAIGHAAGHGWPVHAVNLAGIIARYLDVGGFFAEAIIVHDSAIGAAELARDPRAEARALLNLGDIRVRRAQYDDALRCYERALDLARLTGDQLAEYRELNGLARINRLQGRYPQAAGYYQQILDLSRSAGNRYQQSSGLLGLGAIATYTGRFQQAVRQLEEAADIADAIGERILRAAALNCLGALRLQQGRYQQAAAHLQECRAICRDAGDQVIGAYALCFLAQADVRQGQHRQPETETQIREVLAQFRASGNRNAEILALSCLGELQRGCARYPEARESLEQALAICHQTGALQERAEVLNLLGEVSLAAGDPVQARSRHYYALALASQIGDILQQAHAHRALGTTEAALGNRACACRHWEQALARYAELGSRS